MRRTMLEDPALKKLARVLGDAAAAEVVATTLAEIGCGALETADDRYKFAVALMRRGGVLEAVGRAIKIQAILLGAKEV